MTVELQDLDAHEQPSDELRAEWKAFSKADKDDLLGGGYSIDDPLSAQAEAEFRVARTIPRETLNKAFHDLASKEGIHVEVENEAKILYHPILPGLLIVPSLVPPEIQKVLLRRMVHRDLSQPQHQTNMHLHFNLPYPTGSADTSFFSYPPESPIRFEPKDPTVHKPLSVKQVLDRRLHWVTFGGQYDWTNRVYPGELPPNFPTDIASFLETLFPDTRAQAAILNFYTPGDTMMMHRDVSEETNKGLVSLSFGCDGLFMIAPNDIGKLTDEELKAHQESGEKQFLVLRLRSGDAIYMTGESRYAWHGVPKVLKGTCPEYLQDWPAEDGKYEKWREWMKNKRINLNVRQMRD